MSRTQIYLAFAATFVAIEQIWAHGNLIQPLSRSSVWQYYPSKGEVNNYFNQISCGGGLIPEKDISKRCGPCGDFAKQKVPRDNENGGKYGKSPIVRIYKPNQRIKVIVDLSKNHKGYFEFAICPLKNDEDVETDECFARNPVKLSDGSARYDPGERSGEHAIDVVLPEDLECERCTFRWHYRAANNWGFCQDGTMSGKVGCGSQEVFRSCADISIRTLQLGKNFDYSDDPNGILQE